MKEQSARAVAMAAQVPPKRRTALGWSRQLVEDEQSPDDSPHDVQASVEYRLTDR